MQDKLIEAEIDDGILGVVLVLNDAGVKTFSSCQGGGYGWGHGYLRPIVCFDGDDSEGERAEKIATDAGYQVFQVQRVWYTRDGERVGPFWEMEFVAGAACRAPKDRAAVRAHDAGKDGAALITAERSRQIAVEGWTSVHDDQHSRGSLARAAECYLICGLNQSNGVGQQKNLPLAWPWGEKWWKPSDDPVRNLVKAGALIAAEIDRLNRPASLPHREPESTQEPPASHAAESAPQLDAEDPAEPVEGHIVPCYHCGSTISIGGRPFDPLLCGPCYNTRDVWQKSPCVSDRASVLCREDTQPAMSLAIIEEQARKGYVKMQDVEKALYAGRYKLGFLKPVQLDEVIADLHARLAPKPSLAEEIAKILERSAHLVIDMPRRNKLAEELAALVERRTGK